MTPLPDVLLGRRAALIALSVALAVAALMFVVPVVATFVAQQRVMDDSLNQLAVYRAEAKLQPQLEGELKVLQQRGTTAPGLILADSTALAEAELQRQLKAIVEANAGELQSAQGGASKQIGDLELISVQSDLLVPMTRLSALIYALESHTPYIFIDRADISAPMGWQTQSQAAAKPQPEPKLSVRWTIHAYRWSAK
jgi:hypothetical protein